MPILYFVSMRIKTAVGSNNAITIEVIIACRITAVVATIGKNLLSRDWTLVTKTLVYKVPNVATLIFRILALRSQYSLNAPSELPMA